MTHEYKEMVLLAYEKKKENGTLSDNLTDPSPGKLRDECLIVFYERYTPKDDEILRLFFSSKIKEGDYGASIRNFNIDELRPLVNMLKDKIKRPSDKNIKLLSWLIDFEPRPYRFGQTYPEHGIPMYSQTRTDQGSNTIEKPESNPEPEGENQENPIKNWKRNAAILFSSALLILFGFYKYPDPGETHTSPDVGNILTKYIPTSEEIVNKRKEQAKEKKCMYWVSDHYEAIYCDQNTGDTIKYMLDMKKVDGFKKITRPDTLTRNSIGKVYLSKINGVIEYFTAEGFHPTETERKLRPLSKYMFDKYLAKDIQ